MCFICKDFGRHAKHKHVLLEAEAEGIGICLYVCRFFRCFHFASFSLHLSQFYFFFSGVRNTINSALNHMQKFSEEISETAIKISEVIDEIKGTSSGIPVGGGGGGGDAATSAGNLRQSSLGPASSQEMLPRSGS